MRVQCDGFLLGNRVAEVQKCGANRLYNRGHPVDGGLNDDP